MADEREGDDDVLLRIREQGGAFAAKSDYTDDKLNDGNTYKGILSAAEYKKRRAEALEDPEEKKRELLLAARNADRAARDRDVRDREDREAARREKLRRELASADGDETAQSEAERQPPSGDGDDGGGGPKKKKKKKLAGGAALSFDVDDE